VASKTATDAGAADGDGSARLGKDTGAGQLAESALSRVNPLFLAAADPPPTDNASGEPDDLNRTSRLKSKRGKSPGTQMQHIRQVGDGMAEIRHRCLVRTGNEG
jgi:hypothetical protein